MEAATYKNVIQAGDAAAAWSLVPTFGCQIHIGTTFGCQMRITNEPQKPIPQYPSASTTVEHPCCINRVGYTVSHFMISRIPQSSIAIYNIDIEYLSLWWPSRPTTSDRPLLSPTSQPTALTGGTILLNVVFPVLCYFFPCIQQDPSQ